MKMILSFVLYAKNRKVARPIIQQGALTTIGTKE